MNGIIKKVELKEYKADNGKFKKLEITCDVTINDKGDIKILKSSMNEDYARRYLKYCGTTTKEILGKECECILAKRKFENSEGKEVVYTYIKYLNLKDEDGKSIIMPKEGETNELDF